jgi:predicted transcriptional regulator
MAERLIPHNVLTVEEILNTEIILNQTLIDLLIKKNIITVEEMMNGIKETKKEREIINNNWDSNIR